MNLSGQSVAAALRFYKLPPQGMIVIHDELDLRPGQVKVKLGGGHAGHNGLRSLDAHVGRDYWRIRLGIGHPGAPGTGARLHPPRFRPARRRTLAQASHRARWPRRSPLLAAGDDGRFLNKVVVETSPPRPVKPRPAPKGDGQGDGNDDGPGDGFQLGIVGLPNVGKSTLFNALTATAAAEAANYPFCTIEPNVGRVAVPDERLATLAARRPLAQSGAHSARLRRHRRFGEGCEPRRGSRQSVPRPYPRSGCHRPCGALLRRRCRPCRGLDRPAARYRHGRDRIDAGRPGKSGTAVAGAHEAGQKRGQRKQSR